MKPLSIILIVAAYLAYAAFWIRLGLHTVLWLRAAQRQPGGLTTVKGRSPVSFATAVIDIIFFRRLFASNKLLWLGSWVFHISFLVVLLRHLRYFLEPVPDCIITAQPFGIFAGYLMAGSLAYVILLRTAEKARYLSRQNYLILGLVFLIGLTGLIMRNFFPPDLVDVKSFAMGLVGMKPAPLPGDTFFSLHLILVLLLIPFLPFHIFTAPLVIVEARRREDALEKVLHD
jgi:nitrate reductase gamma subunit